MRCIARGSLASPAKSGRDLYESLSLILGITCSTAAAMEQETVFWESVRDSDQITDVQAYLDQYPNGRFAALARNRIRRLRNATDTQPDKLEPSRMKLDLAFWQSIKAHKPRATTRHIWSSFQMVNSPDWPRHGLPRRHWNSRRPLDSPVRPPRRNEPRRREPRAWRSLHLSRTTIRKSARIRRTTARLRRRFSSRFMFSFTPWSGAKKIGTRWAEKKQQRSASIGRQAHRMKLQSWTAVVVQTISAWGATWNASKVAHATAGAVNKCVDVRTSKCIAPGSLDTSLSHAAGLSDIAVCHA